MEEKDLCRARIEGGFTRKTVTIFWIIYAILFILGFFFGSRCYDDGSLFIYWYNLELFYHYVGRHYVENGIDFLCVTFFAIIVLLPPLVFFIWRALVRKSCSQSTLVLTTEKIYGAHKWFLKDEQILMPMPKIDNIIVRYNFIDRLYGGGGRTVRIASNSGFVNFPCVQNAEDFANLAMEQLEKYRKSLNTDAASPAPDSAIVNKLQSLQALKEQGILSEEEFNAKKAELLSKM